MSKRHYASEIIFDIWRLVSSPERSKAMQTTFKVNGMNDVKAQRKLVMKLNRNLIKDAVWIIS